MSTIISSTYPILIILSWKWCVYKISIFLAVLLIKEGFHCIVHLDCFTFSIDPEFIISCNCLLLLFPLLWLFVLWFDLLLFIMITCFIDSCPDYCSNYCVQILCRLFRCYHLWWSAWPGDHSLDWFENKMFCF